MDADRTAALPWPLGRPVSERPVEREEILAVFDSQETERVYTAGEMALLVWWARGGVGYPTKDRRANLHPPYLLPRDVRPTLLEMVGDGTLASDTGGDALRIAKPYGPLQRGASYFGIAPCPAVAVAYDDAWVEEQARRREASSAAEKLARRLAESFGDRVIKVALTEGGNFIIIVTPEQAAALLAQNPL
jgi:hypothetical protein